MIRTWFVLIGTAVLVLTWTFTMVSKLVNYSEFADQLRNQPFPLWASSILAWLLPVVGLTVAVLLVMKRTQIIGLLVSVILVFVFTVYIVLIQLHVFDYVPCSCAGIVDWLSWSEHLIVNGVLLLLSVVVLIVERSGTSTLKESYRGTSA